MIVFDELAKMEKEVLRLSVMSVKEGLSPLKVRCDGYSPVAFSCVMESSGEHRRAGKMWQVQREKGEELLSWEEERVRWLAENWPVSFSNSEKKACGL